MKQISKLFLIIMGFFFITSCDNTPDPLTDSQITVSMLNKFSNESDTVVAYSNINHVLFTKNSDGEIRTYVEVTNTDRIFESLGYQVITYILLIIIGASLALIIKYNLKNQ